MSNNSTNSTNTNSTDTNTTTTTTTTTLAPENTTEYLLQRCYESVLSDGQNDIVKYLMYFCGGWIIAWCIITMLVNICHKNTGHQRYVHFYEELSIILLAVCMCILNFIFNHKSKVCKFVAIFNHFFMCLTAAIFFAEALFASSMVHGKSDKNGSVPWILYYLFPIVLAVAPTLATFFTEEKYYGTAYLHCFADSTVDMFWGFVIPVWILLTIAGLKAQLACIACDRQQPSQDIYQCYWARRSVKSLVLISQYLFSIWLMILFAAEHQKLYVFILVTCMALLFGPALFVCHTYCHLNTCKKWAGNGCFASLYAMCPPKPSPPEKDEDEEEQKHKDAIPEKTPIDEPDPKNNNEPGSRNQSDSDDPHQYTPTKSGSPVPKQGPNKHTESQKFYSWLTDTNASGKSGDILFRPSVA
ncbi:Protein CBG05257 [Caenorhabditis briggsae]|nr:Protein CBG05257 [Caenorhabditis briggsae]CAP25782.2 Protein CBG05257 [Caenorhabditis briggsae]